MDAGDVEKAKVHAQIAEAQSRLALAATTVLTSNLNEAGTYRLAVGGRGL